LLNATLKSKFIYQYVATMYSIQHQHVNNKY